MNALEGVGGTAVGVAAIRANESARPDRLFDDPYAAAFVAAFPPRDPASRPPRAVLAALSFHVRVRTRFFDDFLLGAALPQVVLVAAGLDSRAYRLDWPAGTRLYELDMPEVLAAKEEVLAAASAQPRCERVAVPADLRADWAGRLADAGLVPSRPTAWLVEGLLVYLSAREAESVLTTVGRLSAPGSVLGVEGGTMAAVLAGPASSAGDVTGLFRGGLGADLATWLSGHGWAAEAHTLETLGARYGRTPPGASRSTLVTATFR